MVKTEVIARPFNVALGAKEKTVRTSPAKAVEQSEEFGEPEAKTRAGRSLPCHNNIHLLISTCFGRGQKAEEDGPNVGRETINITFCYRYHFNI